MSGTAQPSAVEQSEIARRIARMAARLFATKGYEATSVRDIVEAAEVTKPTLYYYFESKEGLAHALLTVPMQQLIAAHERTLASDQSPVEKLAALFEQGLEFCRQDPDRGRFVYAILLGPQGAALAGELKEYAEALVTLMARVVEQLAQEGIVDAVRVPSCIAAARGLMTIYTMDFLYGDLRLDEGLGRRLVDDLIRGFAPRPASE